MADLDSYRTTLDRLQRDLVQAETRTSRLREGIAAIRAIIDAEGGQDPGAATVKPVLRADGSARDPRIATATMEEAAILAFEKVRQPMRVRQLYDAMMGMGYPYTKGFDVFKGSMIPILRRKPRFSKVETGVYQLRAWTA